jgi:ADP-heptose:LPS heptosyltransferase
LLLSHLRAAVLPRPPIDRTDESRPQISIRVSGGLGDYIVMARFLRDLHAAVEDFVFDIYASTTDSAKWVFADLPGFRACRPDIFFERTKADYDLSMAIHQSLAIDRDEIRWRELRRFPKLLHTCNQLLKYQKEIAVFVEHQPRMDNFLARKAVFADRTRHNFLHHMAEIAFGGNLLPLPFKHVEIPQPYVTVHNGFDPRFIISGSRATKCYPYFADVVAQIKERHPGVAIVQLGTSTSEAMANVDHNLIDRTSLEEVAGLIRNARLHIDNEGGLVHLASCFGVKSCVVFGPTPVDYFGYDENINVPPPICGGCWWINETWMDRCPRLFASPICMAQQDPSKIASLVIAELDRAL